MNFEKKELIEQAISQIQTQGQSGDYYELACFALWHLLSGGAKDTLVALVNKGPLYDGDVPSKAGRDELLEYGLASKACVAGEQGYQVANYIGWQVARSKIVLQPREQS